MDVQSLSSVQFSRSVVSNSLQPMGCSPPGSAVHGILQARILEWVAMPFSRGSSQPKDHTAFFASPAQAGGLFTTSTTWKAKKKKKKKAFQAKEKISLHNSP